MSCMGNDEEDVVPCGETQTLFKSAWTPNDTRVSHTLLASGLSLAYGDGHSQGNRLDL